MTTTLEDERTLVNSDRNNTVRSKLYPPRELVRPYPISGGIEAAAASEIASSAPAIFFCKAVNYFPLPSLITISIAESFAPVSATVFMVLSNEPVVEFPPILNR